MKPTELRPGDLCSWRSEWSRTPEAIIFVGILPVGRPWDGDSSTREAHDTYLFLDVRSKVLYFSFLQLQGTEDPSWANGGTLMTKWEVGNIEEQGVRFLSPAG